MPQRDAHGWRSVARDGLVYISELETGRDPGLTYLQAMEIALMVFEAAEDAKRQLQPHHERREYFDDPIRAAIVAKYRAARWPAELTDDDWATIDAEWRARRGG